MQNSAESPVAFAAAATLAMLSFLTLLLRYSGRLEFQTTGFSRITSMKRYKSTYFGLSINEVILLLTSVELEYCYRLSTGPTLNQRWNVEVFIAGDSTIVDWDQMSSMLSQVMS